MTEHITSIRLGAVITTNKKQYNLDTWPKSFQEAEKDLHEFFVDHGDLNFERKTTFGFQWDVTNPHFHPSAEYQNIFFRSQEIYCNDRLRAGKFLTVNDIADALGFERSPQGMVHGWGPDEQVVFVLRRNDNGEVTVELTASNIYEKMRGN